MASYLQMPCLLRLCSSDEHGHACGDMQGLDVIAAFSSPGDLARPRRFELAAAINRLRSAIVVQHR